MDVKAETSNGAPAVKTEVQNTPQKNGPQQQQGGPSGANKFNKGANMQNKNKNFLQKGNRPMGGGSGGPGENFNRGNRGPPKSEINERGMGMNAKKSEDFMINQKLKNLTGPMTDLPEMPTEEVKFSGRNRLYVGNLTNDVTEEELKDLFSPYGEISEAFINPEKNFAFLKIDYRANAERAKKELDGMNRKGKQIRVRFAPNATTIRVKNLTPFVSNELLYKAFEVFGQVERAVVIVDDRGKSSGEGIVEFQRKSGAISAFKYCNEKCFFLTSCLRPCVVEPFEHIDETDGFPEKNIMKKGNEFFKARQNGPRFAEIGSFEHEFGTKWKQLYDMYKQKHEALKREMLLEEEKLEAQMEFARFEHETESLREQLRKREADRDRQKKEWEDKERQAEEMRLRDEQQMRRQNDEMQMRMQRQDEEMRRRQQENSLFMQAQQLNNMLDQQEMGYGGNNQGHNQGGGRKNYNNNMNNDMNDDRRGGGYGGGMNQGGGGGGGHGNYNQGGNQHYGNQGNQDQQHNRFDGGQRGGNIRSNPWNDRGRDDFQNKRRRY